MSKQTFNFINNSLEFYNKKLLNIDSDIHFAVFPHLIGLTIDKIDVFNKLLKIIGDKDDNYYQKFYNNHIKEVILKRTYTTFNGGFIKFKSFIDINDFLEKIKGYDYIDGNLFINEINILLDNLPEKEIKSKTGKKRISATIKKLVWNTNIGEEIGKAKCVCCKSTDITQMSFNCGHIIAEANGGETIVSNLKPICQNCNSSMGTKNMNDFMKTLK